MLTAYVKAQDSIKFSISETKVLLKHHVNYNKMEKIVVTLEKENQNLKKEIQNYTVSLDGCNKAIERKESRASTAESALVSEKGLYKEEKHKKKFWRKISGGFAIFSLLEGAYIYVTNF